MNVIYVSEINMSEIKYAHCSMLTKCCIGAERSQFENNIEDLFKVKLYTIRSETKKREREKERERDFKYLLTLILTGGHK